MRGRGRGRGRGISNTQRVVNNAIRRNERHDRGQLISPTPYPPKFAVFPWNSYTYSTSFKATTGTTISIGTDDLKARLRAALGFKDDALLTLKIERARVWCISIGDAASNSFAMPNLTVRYLELSSNALGVSSLRQEDRDHGTLNMPAKSGYVWPLRDRCEVFSNSENKNFCLVESYTGVEVVVMVNFLWRAGKGTAITDPSISASSLEDDLTELSLPP